MESQKMVGRLKHEILSDFSKQNRKGLYALTQKMIAYNSNRIEGSTLTSEETASLFDTGSLYANEQTVYRAKDVEEMTGHFTMFNHMLKTLDLPLTDKLIKEFHYYLKAGVFEDMANGYPVGEYKTKANHVSDITTALPEDVPKKMEVLIARYNAISEPSLKEILQFHADFEKIHPFQDGNGRVGRIILFRECLKNHIIPVIIRDESKLRYYQALHALQIENESTPFLEYAKEQQQLYLDEIKPYLGLN